MTGSYRSFKDGVYSAVQYQYHVLTSGKFSEKISEVDQMRGTGVTLDMVVAAFETLPGKRGSVQDVFGAVEALFGALNVLNTATASRSLDTRKVWHRGIYNILFHHSKVFEKSGRKRELMYTLNENLATEPPQKQRKNSRGAKEAKSAMGKVRAFGQLAGR